jgi:type 1 glutamine amidotransferase
MADFLTLLREVFGSELDAAMDKATTATRFAMQWGAVCTCEYAPVQYEGRTHDGRRWYFRARHETVRFGVGDNRSTAVYGSLWQHSFEDGEASWLPHDRALWIIAMCLEAYKGETS